MAFGFLKKAVRSAGRGIKKGVKGVGKGVKGVGKLGRTIGKTLGKVPVVGAGLKGVFNLTVNGPFQIASDVASGVRLDRVAMGTLKRELQNVKDVAPYAQTIISVVPGVGQGISAGLSAGLALASGQPISAAITAAIKGAIPGGALAKSAFDIGQAAVQGKPITSIIMAGIPLDAQQKKALAIGLDAAGRIAKGQRVDKALLAQADNALKLLPVNLSKGLTLGMATAQGQQLQAIAMKAVNPATLNKLKAGGLNLIKTSPILSAAGKVLTKPAEKAGFSVGIAMMGHVIRPIDAIAIRTRLNPIQRKGFDMAVAVKVGMIESKFSTPKTIVNPAQALGFYTTKGLTGTANTKHIIQAVAHPKSPTSQGATVALKAIQVANRPWWLRLSGYLGFTHTV
jgi:hypothetical protein